MTYMVRGDMLLSGCPSTRRVVARRGFSPGESITICPILRISKQDESDLKNTSLGERLFRARGQALFALGYSSICLPAGLKASRMNARAVFDPHTDAIELICVHQINKGEKILCSPDVTPMPGSISTPIADNKIEVRESFGRGRGIFARRACPSRAVIGRYPVLVIPRTERALIFRTVLDLYHCDWGYGNLAIPLGLWMLHNTTSDGTTRTTNANYRLEYKTRTIVNYAIRPIATGDEITIPYRDRNEPLDKLEMYGIVQ